MTTITSYSVTRDAERELFELQLVNSSKPQMHIYSSYWVFDEVAKDEATATGYAAAPSQLATILNDTDPEHTNFYPVGPLASDAAGNLFFWVSGGYQGSGYSALFELSRDDNTTTGYDAWPTLLSPSTATALGYDHGLLVDPSGDLFGTSQYGGAIDPGGLVYELAKDDASSTGYDPAPTVLAGFGGADGDSNPALQMMDSAGDLFGTAQTAAGGIAVFEIAKDDSSATGYDATPTVLASTPGSQTFSYYSPTVMIADANGDLIDSVVENNYGPGWLFKIAKDDASATGYATSATVLGSFAAASLTLDAAGDLFGITLPGDYNPYVFEFAKDDASATGYAASPTVFYTFPSDWTPSADDFTLVNAGAEQILVYSDSTIVSISPVIPCYGRGTLILTDRGEVAVERLAVGDRVVTASGVARPIVWIGNREIEVARHAFPLEILPVRVRAGAFGRALPRRDLWLSPQHAVYLDGALIPIIRLANGASIAQTRVETVAYFHVELDSHDVLIAEGLPAESFLDCGTRSGFANCESAMELHPTFTPKTWGDACAPLKERGVEVDAARRRLLARAERLGFRRCRDPGLQVLADNVAIAPGRDGEWFHFVLPPKTRRVVLKSRSWRPADETGDGDKRHLGVAVAEIVIDGCAQALDALGAGWRPLEQDAGGQWRWSDGSAALPAGGRLLSLRLAGEPHYWVDDASDTGFGFAPPACGKLTVEPAEQNVLARDAYRPMLDARPPASGRAASGGL